MCLYRCIAMSSVSSSSDCFDTCISLMEAIMLNKWHETFQEETKVMRVIFDKAICCVMALVHVLKSFLP